MNEETKLPNGYYSWFSIAVGIPKFMDNDKYFYVNEKLNNRQTTVKLQAGYVRAMAFKEAMELGEILVTSDLRHIMNALYTTNLPIDPSLVDKIKVLAERRHQERINY